MEGGVIAEGTSGSPEETYSWGGGVSVYNSGGEVRVSVFGDQSRSASLQKD